MAKVVVVGAGVIGLSSAIAIQEQVPGVHVTIVADKFTSDTTSDGAGGLFVPDAPGTDASLIRKWGQEGARHFFSLAFSEKSRQAGVYLINGYELSPEPITKPPMFLEFAHSFRKLNQEERRWFQRHYKDGYFVTTVIIEGRQYLPWLSARFLKNGGKIEKRKVESLDEFCGHYDVVVNCSGLGSQQLASDPHVIALRGQIVRVYAPWLKFYLHSSDGSYALPSSENVAVGGTKHENAYDITPDPELSQRLLASLEDKLPPIKGAKKLWDWVGLRPHRFAPRVETEIRRTAEGRTLKIVHNYGHGSLGVSLSWGTGVHVAEMVEAALSSHSRL